MSEIRRTKSETAPGDALPTETYGLTESLCIIFGDERNFGFKNIRSYIAEGRNDSSKFKREISFWQGFLQTIGAHLTYNNSETPFSNQANTPLSNTDFFNGIEAAKRYLNTADQETLMETYKKGLDAFNSFCSDQEHAATIRDAFAEENTRPTINSINKALQDALQKPERLHHTKAIEIAYDVFGTMINLSTITTEEALAEYLSGFLEEVYSSISVLNNDLYSKLQNPRKVKPQNDERFKFLGEVDARRFAYLRINKLKQEECVQKTSFISGFNRLVEWIELYLKEIRLGNNEAGKIIPSRTVFTHNQEQKLKSALNPEKSKAEIIDITSKKNR